MNQNKGRIALFMTLVLVFAILVPVASGIENEISEENQAAEPSLPDLLSGQRGDRNRTNNFTDETGFLNGTYPWSDLPPDYRFDNQLEDNIPYDLLASTGSWTLLNANPGWSARSEHSAVVMPVDGSIVLMGGAGQGLFNDVWRSTDNGVTWTQMVSNAPWTDRSHFTAVAMPDNSIVLMGGRDGSGYRNDVWRSTDNGASWTQMTASAGWSARMCPTSVVLSNNSIVLMGGTGSSGSSNDTWMSQDYGATWSLRSSSPGWRARYVHNSVALPGDNILLLGGYNFGYSWWNDTWLSTDKGATWSLLTMNAEWPGRFSPSTVVMPDGSIVLMGGYGGYLMNDMWQSTDNGTTWERINQTSGWSVRYSHRAATTYDGNVVLMGGVDYSVPYRDVWRYVPAPVANFTATPTSGNRPLIVQFADTSTGSPTAWEWDFDNDGTVDSYDQNPQHTFNEIGSYSVNMTVTNAYGNGTLTRNGYITVTGYYYVYADGVGLYYDGLNTPLYEANNIPVDFYNNLSGKQGSVYSSYVWQGIANPINNDTGSRNWNINDDANSMANNADFAFHAGHGWDNGIKFGTENYAYDMNREDMSFGGNNGRAKWVALFSCSVLNQGNQSYWESVFDGLHILMGFDTAGVLEEHQGSQFAQRMTGYGIYEKTTISNAWVKTLKDTIDDVSIRGAYKSAYPSEDDYLPGFGTFWEPQKDSNGHYNISYVSFNCSRGS